MTLAEKYARKIIDLVECNDETKTKLQLILESFAQERIEDLESDALEMLAIALKFYSEPSSYHFMDIDEYGGLAREVLKKWTSQSLKNNS